MWAPSAKSIQFVTFSRPAGSLTSASAAANSLTQRHQADATPEAPRGTKAAKIRLSPVGKRAILSMIVQRRRSGGLRAGGFQQPPPCGPGTFTAQRSRQLGQVLSHQQGKRLTCPRRRTAQRWRNQTRGTGRWSCRAQCAPRQRGRTARAPPAQLSRPSQPGQQTTHY